MLRKYIVTPMIKDAIADNIYPLFKEGWKLDPWLHSSGRPWTVPNYRGGGPPGVHVWNLIKFEDDDPIPEMDVLTDFQVFLAQNAPIIQLPLVKLEAPPFEDPIVAEELIPHGETAKWVSQGYEAPEKLIWAKNRLVRLRASVATAIMGSGLSEVAEKLLSAMNPNDIAAYLRSIEHEPT